MYILAASPLAYSGFAAIGCFRALPYDGIYIMKDYSKLTAKNPKIVQIDLSVPKEIGFIQTYIGT